MPVNIIQCCIMRKRAGEKLSSRCFTFHFTHVIIFHMILYTVYGKSSTQRCDTSYDTTFHNFAVIHKVMQRTRHNDWKGTNKYSKCASHCYVLQHQALLINGTLLTRGSDFLNIKQGTLYGLFTLMSQAR